MFSCNFRANCTGGHLSSGNIHVHSLHHVLKQSLCRNLSECNSLQLVNLLNLACPVMSSLTECCSAISFEMRIPELDLPRPVSTLSFRSAHNARNSTCNFHEFYDNINLKKYCKIIKWKLLYRIVQKKLSELVVSFSFRPIIKPLALTSTRMKPQPEQNIMLRNRRMDERTVS